MDETPESFEPSDTPTGEGSIESSDERDESPEGAEDREEREGDALLSDANSAKGQNEEFIDMVKGEDYFEVDEEGNRVVGELNNTNREISQLGEDYKTERQAILDGEEASKISEGERPEQLQPLSPAVVDQKVSGEEIEPPKLAAGEKPELLAPLHPVVVEKGVGSGEIPEDTQGQGEGEEQKIGERQSERAQQEMEAVLEVFQKAGYPVKSEADLAKLPSRLTAKLEGYEGSSLVLPLEKIALFVQEEEPNQELERLTALGYNIIRIPLVKESEDLSNLIYVIKTLPNQAEKYMLLVRPEYYYRVSKENSPKSALAVGSIAERLGAEVKLIPSAESKKVDGNIVQLGDGKVILPQEVSQTQGLLEAGIGKENLLLAPPSEGFQLSNLSIPSVPIELAVPK